MKMENSLAVDGLGVMPLRVGLGSRGEESKGVQEGSQKKEPKSSSSRKIWFARAQRMISEMEDTGRGGENEAPWLWMRP
jgi:hypothetical protein